MVTGCTMNFQDRVAPWTLECFGFKIAKSKIYRNQRFLEEALELVQACDATLDECHQLVDYVFSRPVGEKHQEVGGVMVTLASLCNAHNIDLNNEADRELLRAIGMIDRIREKSQLKPKFGRDI